MIVHIVMWQLKDHAAGNDKARNAELVRERIEALRGKIPGLIKIQVGIDFSRTAQSADVALYSEFESRAALDAYVAHPDHQAAAAFIGEVRTPEGRVLADYEV